MPMHLVSSTSGRSHFDDNAITGLRYSPRRRTARGDRVAPFRDADGRASALAPPEGEDVGLLSNGDFAPRERGPDPAVSKAQAEREDVALVKLAAAKLAIALREVHLLLRGDRGAWKSDALARCTAKGWIRLQGDTFAALQTFQVTPEGYRAAGLRVPPFSS